MRDSEKKQKDSEKQVVWHGHTFKERGGVAYIQENGASRSKRTDERDDSVTLVPRNAPMSEWPCSARWFRAAQTWRRLGKKMASAGMAAWAEQAVTNARALESWARMSRMAEMEEEVAS